MKPDRRSLPSASFMIAAWSRVVSPAQRIACLTVYILVSVLGPFEGSEIYCSPSSGIHGHHLRTSICCLSRTP